MDNLIEDYKNFKEKEILFSYQEQIKKLNEKKEKDIANLSLLNDSLKHKSKEKFLYGSAVGFKFVQENKKYVKLFLKGFLEDNLELIQFGDLKIYDNNKKEYISFKSSNLFDIFNSLLEDNTEYTIIEEKNSSYYREYLIKELNISFEAFFDD